MAVVLGVGFGTLILACALAWGGWQYSRRNRANEPITDQATRELYKDPEGYEAGKQDELSARTR